MKTLTLTSYENYLLWFAMVHSPLDGMRISDLPKLEEVKKLFIREAFSGEVEVVVSPDHLGYVRAAWDALPVGKLVRTDDLSAAVDRVDKQVR